MPESPIRSFPLTIAICFFLLGCGEKSTPTNTTESNTLNSDQSNTAQKNYKHSLKDGIGICFQKIRDHFGNNIKIASISSQFQIPEEFSRSSFKVSPEKIQGLDHCKFQYQDPQNPQKLLDVSMNAYTGEFEKPLPVKIQVYSGKVEDFKLEDHVISFEKLKIDPIEKQVALRKPSMDNIFASHQISSFDFSQSRFSGKFEATIRIKGIFKSNSLAGSKSMGFAPDGKLLSDDFKK